MLLGIERPSSPAGRCSRSSVGRKPPDHVGRPASRAQCYRAARFAPCNAAGRSCGTAHHRSTALTRVASTGTTGNSERPPETASPASPLARLPVGLWGDTVRRARGVSPAFAAGCSCATRRPGCLDIGQRMQVRGWNHAPLFMRLTVRAAMDAAAARGHIPCQRHACMGGHGALAFRAREAAEGGADALTLSLTPPGTGGSADA